MQQTLMFDVGAAQRGLIFITLGVICLYIAWNLVEKRNRATRRKVREAARATRRAEQNATIGKRLAQLLRDIEANHEDALVQRRLKDAWLEFREVPDLGRALGELVDAFQQGEGSSIWGIRLTAVWHVLQGQYGQYRYNRL